MAPSLVGISGPLQGITFPLDGDLSIGREPGNDICIPVPAVSRRHGVVRVREASYEIVDLGSRNGTFVNDVPVTQRPLVDGDRISISNSVFVFANPDGADEGKGSSIELVDAQGQTLTVALHAQQALGGGSSQATGQPLARVVETLQALLQINRAVAAIRDPRALQEELLRRLFDVSPADRAALLLYDDREAPPSSIVGLERSGGTLRSIALSRSIAGHVLSHDVAVLVEDVEQRVEFVEARSVELAGAKSLMAIPLTAGERTLGILYADVRRSNRHFDRGDLETAAAVAAVGALALENAMQYQRVRSRAELLLADVNRDLNMVGATPAMQSIYRLIVKVAPSDSTVLLLGESGTGKELAARAIHDKSPRAEKPFVAINCATLSESLLESELFGHEKGAFSGAVAAKPGQLEVANRGTLFLDEVGQIPIPVQGKLLRALQEREFTRLGGTRSVRVDIRVIAATNVDLREAVANGNFRNDLWQRLKVIIVKLPPLRERRDDIGLLANYFVAKCGKKCGRPVTGLSAKAKALLLQYSWPGNVRELENAIERAVVLGEDAEIQPHDLPEDIWESGVSSPGPPDADPESYEIALANFKRALVGKAIRAADGNYTEAARRLGVHVSYLHRLVRTFDLRRELLQDGSPRPGGSAAGTS